ncbi:MAG: helix-turn-helix domain-containing protein [bacterium]|nr:helix-turn-helix domain-containing protein [bacterium]
MTRRELAKKFVTSMERERVRLGLTQAQLAGKLNISLSGYKKMVAGETTKIDMHTAFIMCELSGRMMNELCMAESVSEPVQLYRKIRRLTKEQIDFVESIVDFENEFLSSVADMTDYISVLVPTGCLEDGMIWDSVIVEKMNIAGYRKKYGNLIHCGLKVTSNHMLPAYHVNDVLLLTKRAPRNGDIGIFIDKEEGRAYIRKFHQTNICRLEPINHYGVTFEVDDKCEKDIHKWMPFGCVLTKVRL